MILTPVPVSIFSIAIRTHIARRFTSTLSISHADNKAVRLLEGMKKGERSSLAAAITLVEAEHRLKKLQANEVMESVMKSSHSPNSFRIGLSGPPGAGKSTFIEAIGKKLTSDGHKVAVLAVDPSSSNSGGSILGDKTRMPELTRDPNAYIRPSPARGHLGGVTRSTNEAIVLCEYSGYDFIIVETVGVGQSEYAVANMVDIFVLLLPPGGGDELQGVKRGIVEKADLLIVTKADGDMLSAAHRTQYEYTAALKFIRSSTPNWKTKVLRVSSKTKDGLDGFWSTINEFRKQTKNNFLKKRGEQRVIWMWTHVQDGLKNMILCNPELKSQYNHLSDLVRDGRITPGSAADETLKKFTESIRHI